MLQFILSGGDSTCDSTSSLHTSGSSVPPTFELWNLTRSDNVWGPNGTFSSSHILFSLQSLVFTTIRRYYLENDYFAGGLGLMLIGLLAKSFTSYGLSAWTFFTKKRGVFNLYVTLDDPSFEWLREWLCDHVDKDTSQLTLKSVWDGVNNNDCDTGEFRREAASRPRLLFLPQLQEAQHILFQGHKITFQMEKKIRPVNSDGGGELAALLQSAGSREQMSIQSPSREVLESLVKEAMDVYFKKQEGKRSLAIRRWNARDVYWNHMATRRARPLDSVILDCDVGALIKDAQLFLSSADWYNDRGIPHRRGYIFHGPPGCGKTSLVQALAGELGLDVAMLSLSSEEMDDDNLHVAMSQADTMSVIVLEDVDAVFTKRADGQDKTNSLSFSGLLNAIDGLSAQEGKLLIMTTNHIDRLDPALIRPGRVDMRLYLGLASKRQAELIFTRFFPECNPEDAKMFSEKIPDNTISPASIQGYLLLHRDDAEAALSSIQDLLAEDKLERFHVGNAEPSSPSSSDNSQEDLCQHSDSSVDGIEQADGVEQAVTVVSVDLERSADEYKHDRCK